MVALLAGFATWLAHASNEVPQQDLTISLRRTPALPRSRFLINPVGQSAD
jgi:fatty-acid peroxygenase